MSKEEPTKLFGPNLVGILNAAGFYKKKEWVGLTAEDLKILSAEWRIVYGAWMDEFARDIEAKLKEKNT